MTQGRRIPGPFAPSEADLSRCVRCGLCLQHCPTYLQTGLETESPRGRLYLIRALAEGRIEPTGNVAGHLDQCLQCRNCEAVCPSGVPYGRIMEGARAVVLSGDRPPASWRLRAFFLRQVVARPGRLAVLASALRAYQASGLRNVVERIPVVRDRALLAPTFSGRPFRGSGVIARPAGPARRQVAILTGCIMPLAYGRVHRATVRVLARNGCEVIAPAAQVCCGALHAHNGDAPTARDLARRNIDVFLQTPGDAIVVNSAGCGAAMKEYGEALAEDPLYREKARRFSSLVTDIHEFLVNLPFDRPAGALDLDVTYQDPCHLAHAQRLPHVARQVLEAIPGLRLIELAHGDRCCGSAGVYSLTQARMSLRLLDEKMTDVARTGANLIATANPGCMAQLEAGLRRHRLPGRVLHVMELLDRSYRAAPAP